MSNKKIYSGIMEGLQEAKEFFRGKNTGAVVHRPADIKALREKYKLSQAKFAREFGLNIETVRGWEQDRRFPDNSSRILLQIIDQYPNIVKNIVKMTK
jgi:putative transcriptional regulator